MYLPFPSGSPECTIEKTDRAHGGRSSVFWYPGLKGLRPTTGKVVQALFNILGQDLGGLRFLDLFAGTGKVGLEAHQRGALVVAVESDRRRSTLLSRMAPPEGFQVRPLDVRRALPMMVQAGETYDVVFADPPYHLGWVKQFLELWEVSSSLLAPGGCMILEHSKRESIPASWEKPYETRVYGETLLTLFR